MAEVPTEHLQLQKIRAAAEAVLAKLDNESDPQLVNILASTVADLKKLDLLSSGRVYVENLQTLRNADFEQWITDYQALGWIFSDTTGAIEKSDLWAFMGEYSLRFNADDQGKITQLLEVPIHGSYIERLSLVGVGYDIRGDSKITICVKQADGYSTCADFTLGYLTETFCDMTPYIPDGEVIVGVSVSQKIIVPPPQFRDCMIDSIILLMSEVPRLPAIFLDGQQIVVTAGTPVALGSGKISHSVLIQPIPTNTGNILVGNSADQHFVLTPTSEPIRVFVNDLADIYIDATVNGEGVNYIGG